ncbi:MAG: hypothetical protein CR975_07300 [Gammaproteobacteria bacterium]|nr:MAG: hypothetical protein CR975_07300 [Gammaproteobacteria bacterium]
MSPNLLQAVDSLEKALEKDSTQTAKQLELAHCYEIMGRYPKAIIAYGKAWEVVKKSPDELVRFADVLARSKGNHYAGKPKALLKQALELDHQHVDALISYGTALLSERQQTLAAEYWQKAHHLLDRGDPRYTELEKLLSGLSE